MAREKNLRRRGLSAAVLALGPTLVLLKEAPEYGASSFFIWIGFLWLLVLAYSCKISTATWARMTWINLGGVVLAHSWEGLPGHCFER